MRAPVKHKLQRFSETQTLDGAESAFIQRNEKSTVKNYCIEKHTVKNEKNRRL